MNVLVEAGQTVEEKLKAMIAKIGENMNIRRFEKVTTDGLVVSYIHAGGKIGVLVVADTDSDSDAVKECLKNVAMQIAALNPKYVSSDDVDADYKEHEKQVLLAQAKNGSALRSNRISSSAAPGPLSSLQ